MPDTPSPLASRAFLLLQRMLPKFMMTRLVRSVAGWRLGVFKNLLIRGFVRLYRVDTSDVARSVPGEFADFNDFFTRELKDGARTVDGSPAAIVSPADGIVSATGRLDRDSMLQAKGLHYSLRDLLAADLEDTARFEDGLFATVYLAPYNYHRVHCPLAAELTALHYVPGQLYSVNRMTVTTLRDLFARNERLVCRFRTEAGPMALVLVGALHVGSITTPWTGRILPRKRGVVEVLEPDTDAAPLSVPKGGLVGWFNMGSTVILLLPPGSGAWRAGLDLGTTVRMGERLGTLAAHAQG